MIEKNFPAPSSSPGRVIRETVIRFVEPSLAGVFEHFHHMLCPMLVLANKEMNVIRHDPETNDHT